MAVALALSGCQLPRPGVAQTDGAAVAGLEPAPDAAVLPAVPACNEGGTATLSNGLVVRFGGADPRDNQVCLVSWNGRTHRYLAGFWGGGRFAKGTQEERDGIARALTGPVGTTTSFEDVRAGLWGQVTVEHMANPVLALKSGPRRTVLLRVVKHDASGRARVRVETLAWIDAKTGVALKRQAVTRLADGRQQVATTWEIERLDGLAS